MLADPITHLTMHRVHDERGDSSRQMGHTWEQREKVGETLFARGGDFQRMRGSGDNPTIS